MKKLYFYIILAVVVVGSGGYLLLSNSNGKDPKYRTEKVSRGNVVVNVRATGTINPVQTVQVGSQVSGTLSKIFVDFNSEVKKGQIIAIIDSTFLYASVMEARANLERNQAQVNEAERNFKRTTELFKKDLVSQADLDAAKTAYESAVAQKKQSLAALDRAMVNLRYAIIRAPIDGIVISRDVDVGQTVAASLQSPKLFEIANDLKQMQVEASVDEADIGQVKTDQTVTFTVDAYPEEQFRGSVTQVRLSPITVQNVVTYTVIIEVSNPDMKLRPGMTATVSILVDSRDDVLRVPVLATRFQPPSDILEKIRETKSTVADSGSQRTKQQEQRQEVQQGSERQRWQSGGDSLRRGESRERGERFRNQGQLGGDRQQLGMRWRMEGEHQRKVSHVWILDNNNLKQLSVTTGLNDNRFIEIIGEGLKEGDEVIVGTTGTEMTSMQTQQSNPFQQRMPGGGGGGRRGF